MKHLELRDQVYAIFLKMKPGELIPVGRFKKDPEGFIQYGKDFIDDGNYNYEFTDQYKGFRRMWHTIDEVEAEKEKRMLKYQSA